jgi:hypothetical protein
VYAEAMLDGARSTVAAAACNDGCMIKSAFGRALLEAAEAA